MRKDWWAPLTGVAFVVLLIVGLIVAGEPPDADEGAAKIVDFYADDKDKIELGAAISLLGASFFVWFAATLRDALRNAGGGDDGIAPNVILAGAIITATGAAIDNTISFALAEAARDIDPVAVQALQGLWDNDFMPLALGLHLFLLASGLSILRRGALPKWLGWVAVVLGVLGITPVGWVAFLAGAVWVLVVSVLLTLHNRAPAAATPPTAQPVGVTP
jgi:hypothetical protein